MPFATTIAFALLAQQSMHIAVGEPAPKFDVKLGEKQFALEALIAKKPLFVVFWKQRCPHNKAASALFNNLAKAYEGKAQLVGFVNAEESGADAWTKQFSLNYPLLPDPAKDMIKGYKMAASIVTVEIGTDGKIAKVFPGYGAEAMNALNEAMAKAAGAKGEVDLSAAPVGLTYG